MFVPRNDVTYVTATDSYTIVVKKIIFCSSPARNMVRETCARVHTYIQPFGQYIWCNVKPKHNADIKDDQ